MNTTIPAWALRAATPQDHAIAQVAHGQRQLQITWPDPSSLRSWAKQQGWPRPFFGFEAAFLAKMLETPETFALAIAQSGIALQLPKEEYVLSAETIDQFDALYAERSADGRPTSWGALVGELREIRRAVEAGVVVKIAGEQSLRSWQSFYSWAHGRYHMLEDGYDQWIGDDS